VILILSVICTDHQTGSRAGANPDPRNDSLSMTEEHDPVLVVNGLKVPHKTFAFFVMPGEAVPIELAGLSDSVSVRIPKNIPALRRTKEHG